VAKADPRARAAAARKARTAAAGASTPTRPAGTPSRVVSAEPNAAVEPAGTAPAQAAPVNPAPAKAAAPVKAGPARPASGKRVVRDERGRPMRSPLEVPTWLPIVSLTLAVIGLGLSAYLTYEHYTGSTTLACSDNGAVNCLQVTTSAESKVFGIPVALLGLLYFIAMIPALVPAAWRSRASWLRIGRTVAAVVGIGFVFYLLYAELFSIGKICLYCTGVHAVTVVLFAVILFGQASITDADER
jgi:uncharacterized membrane protein